MMILYNIMIVNIKAVSGYRHDSCGQGICRFQTTFFKAGAGGLPV